MTKELPVSHFIPLDEEERVLMEAIENDEITSVENQEEERLLAKIAAKNTLKRIRKKSLTLRLEEIDIDIYKFMSEKEWIPYQTLLWSAIHKYGLYMIENYKKSSMQEVFWNTWK